MLKRLSRTKIEYGNLNWSFYPGCKHDIDTCPVNPHCWAKAMSKRLKRDFHQPHLIPELLLAPLSIRKPSGILVNFMGDLFGDWVNQDELVTLPDPVTGLLETKQLWQWIQTVIWARPEHRFLSLTKAPQNIRKWGWFPDNSYVGVTACNQRMFDKALIYLSDVGAKHKWLSIEPLLEEIVITPADLESLSWVVIGAQSQPIRMPEKVWLDKLVMACSTAGIPYWEKNNLKLLLGRELHQDFPKSFSGRIKDG